MNPANLFDGKAARPRMRKRTGRPTLLNDPEHVGRRAFALASLRAGEPRKKICAALDITRMTLWRWENGKIGQAKAG